jgi:cytidylate kinase
MSRYTADEVLQLAARGNVLIRGWGAAQLLRDIPHVMCVRICAPMSKRVAVMMERLGIGDDQAIRREIERNDSAHSRTVQRQFDGDWRDAENYDVVLNTGFLPVKTCVAQLKAIALSGAYEETEQSRRLLADKSIEAEVRRILDAYAADSNFGSGLNVGVTPRVEGRCMRR